MLGFPAWPSFIMPSDLIPKPILKVQKKSTNFCVIFIPDGDYNWMTEKQLEALTKDKIDTRLSKVPKTKLKKPKGGRTKNINDALSAARDLSFDDFMDLLERRRNGEEEDDDDEDEEEEEQEVAEEPQEPEEEVKNEANGDEAEEEEAEESAKDEKLKQDGASEADGEEDEEEEEVRPSKRTRNSNGSRKIAKTAPKPKTKIFSQPTNGDTKIKDELETNGKKPSAASKALTEEEKQHQLWLCRIKLQRSLIQRNQPVTPTNTKQYPPPTVDELSVARLILHRLVEFPVSVELLKKTKIHKVLKCIIRDEDLEYPDSFKLHEKCEELLAKWNSLIEALKLEKLVKVMNSHTNSSPSAQDKNGVNKIITKVHDNESRLSSQAPEESEISAVENSEILEKKNGHVEKASSSDEDVLKKVDIPVAASVEG